MKVKNDHRSEFSNLSNWKEAWKFGKNWKNWKELYCLTTHFERKTRDIIFHSQHIPSPRDIFPYTETLNFLIIISKILRY